MIWYQDNSGLYINRDIFEAKLRSLYSLRNLKRTKMLAMGQTWQARNEPEYHEHWWVQWDQVKIPFGLLGSSWHEKIDRTQVHERTKWFVFKPTLQEKQSQAITNLLRYPVGILKAGTGTGKSYMILYLAATLKRKTLILVHSTVCLKEMATKCEEFLWVVPQVFWGTKKYKSTTDEITICLVHSVWKLNLYEYWAIIADECDVMVSTEDRQKIWYHCSPDYLYGFTATLTINMQEKSLINIFFWKAEASLGEVSMKPIIKVVPTRFTYTRPLEKNADFAKLMPIIAEDSARNNLIIEKVYATLPQTETKKALVVIKSIAQAKILQDWLTAKGMKTFLIIGETPEEERQKIRDEVLSNPEPIVIIWSAQILGRGFDLPPLQAVYLCYPNRFDEALVQVVGRVLRKYEGKTYWIVYDLADIFVNTLRRQFESRKRTYKKKYWVEVK